LETNASVNALWMASTVTPSQAVWRRLNFNNVPLNAKAIEVHNGVIYVGTRKGVYGLDVWMRSQSRRGRPP
jgi:hypothetical protein